MEDVWRRRWHHWYVRKWQSLFLPAHDTEPRIFNNGHRFALVLCFTLYWMRFTDACYKQRYAKEPHLSGSTL